MNFSSSPNIFKESYDILDNILRRGGYSTLELNRAAASDTVRRIVLGTLDKNFELEYIINNLSESKP
ncbi:MAG TPA: hypothetical protein P5161_07665, partial [Eubacteriales bacterium]|nr:hypothetical protein [Eubacteriales bacterium]